MQMLGAAWGEGVGRDALRLLGLEQATLLPIAQITSKACGVGEQHRQLSGGSNHRDRMSLEATLFRSKVMPHTSNVAEHGINVPCCSSAPNLTGHRLLLLEASASLLPNAAKDQLIRQNLASSRSIPPRRLPVSQGGAIARTSWIRREGSAGGAVT